VKSRAVRGARESGGWSNSSCRLRVHAFAARFENAFNPTASRCAALRPLNSPGLPAQLPLLRGREGPAPWTPPAHRTAVTPPTPHQPNPRWGEAATPRVPTHHPTLPPGGHALPRPSGGGGGHPPRAPAPPSHPTAVTPPPPSCPTPRHPPHPPVPPQPAVWDREKPLSCELRVMVWSGIDPGRADVSIEWFGREVT